MRILSLLVLMLSCLSAGAGQGAVPPAAEVCEWATQQAARESGVPPDILGALTLTETGWGASTAHRFGDLDPVTASEILRTPSLLAATGGE